MKRNRIILVIAISLIFGCSQPMGHNQAELQQKLNEFPTIKEFLVHTIFQDQVKAAKDVAVYCFTDTSANEPVYVAWSKTGQKQIVSLPKGTYWVMDTAQVAIDKPFAHDEIPVFESPVFILQAADPSPVIHSVYPEGLPIVPFESDGDLWLSTWADDGNLYSGWGDGRGPLNDAGTIPWVDCGIVKLTGDLPALDARAMYRQDETPPLPINDKPSSLIYLDTCLYGQFHSPLGDARIGYLAESKDYGKSWNRIGYFEENEKQTASSSPWLRDKKSPFRCLFFINMGQNYILNTDGYVYALGIGTEWHWMGLRIYLARVRKENLKDYKAYEYFGGYAKNDEPQWTENQAEAKPVKGPITFGQGSAIYHPGTKRYLFMTDFDVFDAPYPWGPWTYAGTWTTWKTCAGKKEWQGGYQPGIISKDTGSDYFWFTVSGQNSRPYITYSCNLGKMMLRLRN